MTTKISPEVIRIIICPIFFLTNLCKEEGTTYYYSFGYNSTWMSETPFESFSHFDTEITGKFWFTRCKNQIHLDVLQWTVWCVRVFRAKIPNNIQIPGSGNGVVRPWDGWNVLLPKMCFCGISAPVVSIARKPDSVVLSGWVVVMFTVSNFETSGLGREPSVLFTLEASRDGMVLKNKPV